MRSTKNIFLLRFINALIFIVLLFIQYNGVFSLKIANANPMLPLSLLVALCMFCSEISAFIAGLVVGTLIDSAASTPDGFNAIVFSILGLAAALVVRYLFNNNIFSALALCFICTTVYFIARWLCTFAFSVTFAENLTYLMRTVFPSVIYTAVFSVPFYLFEKKLYKKLYNQSKI